MPRTKEQFEDIRNKTKRNILENALMLFAEKGFKGTSISDIARSAGISKGLAYNYFKNKDDLVISVFEMLTKEVHAILASADNENDPKKKLRMFINQTFNQVINDEKFWRLYMNFVISPEMQQKSNKILGEFLEEMLYEFKKIFVQMKIPNPSNESKILLAIIDGVCFHFMIDKDKYPIETIRRYLLKKYCT